MSAVTGHSRSSGRLSVDGRRTGFQAALLRPWRRHPREQDRRKGKEQNPFARVGTSTRGQLQGEPGREVKMGTLEELDDPGALQPEREVAEHATQ